MSCVTVPALWNAALQRWNRSSTELWQTCRPAGLESGGQLLAPLQQETLVSWVVLVMQTLEEVGAPISEQVAHLRHLSSGEGNTASERARRLWSGRQA